MKKLYLFVFFVTTSFLLQAQTPEFVMPFSYWLKGKIGNSDFEMLFNMSFDQKNTPCASVQGKYFYPSMMKSIEFKGNYCYNDKTLKLDCENGEKFDFTIFDGKIGSGTWEKDGKRQNLTAQTISTKERQTFVDFVASQIKDGSSASEQILTIIKDENYGEQCPNVESYARGAHIAFGCAFEYENNYSGFFLLPDSAVLQVLEIQHNNAYTPEYNEKGEQIPYHSTSLAYSVYEYKSDKWTLKNSAELYKKDKLSDGAEMLFDLLVASNGTICVTSSQNNTETRLRWQWDGKKMVKK